MRLIFVLSLLLLSATSFPATAKADHRSSFVLCESEEYRFRFCPANTNRGVRLAEELSKRNCVYQRTWGFDGRGIWVDGGCRARFDLGGRNNSATLGGYPGDPFGGPSSGGGGGWNSTNDVPRWAVGRFVGYDPRSNRETRLSVSPDGSATLYSYKVTVRGYVDGDRLVLDSGAWYRLFRTRDGFSAERRGSEAIFFRPERHHWTR